MKSGNLSLRPKETKHIRYEQHKCRACWKCFDVCSNHVFSKIALPFHKHIYIDNPELCKGCQKCVEVCPEKAISPIRVDKNIIRS